MRQLNITRKVVTIIFFISLVLNMYLLYERFLWKNQILVYAGLAGGWLAKLHVDKGAPKENFAAEPHFSRTTEYPMYYAEIEFTTAYFEEFEKLQKQMDEQKVSTP